ncbi:sialin [Aethina tumida]|uniref:sialin n=1 Tax=Aethina tumida TaxID=116153 RepID=UPI00096B592F|nr:sialin [Aethina tumida]XP_049819092.1 sialin [Aethina tumida]
MEKIKDTTECCSARNVLWYLVFTGFAVNYMIRINLNIALVSMISARPKDNITITSECLVDTLSIEPTNITYNITEKSLKDDIVTTVLSTFNTTEQELSNNEEINLAQDESNKFDWDVKLQSKILGSFFWVHWLTQIPGGIMAGKYGTKLVFGVSNFLGVVLCFAIPWSAHYGAYYLIVIRVLQGLFTGASWPAMHNMTARWIPPNERSKFVTAYLGSSVGAALTYPMCGFIIDRWGWESVFYVCGVLGTAWYASWWLLVYDSPAEHPRITEDEKEYIMSNLGESYAKKRPPIPWKNILTNGTVIMNVIAQFGGVWGLFALMTHSPTYFKFIHGWNIRATGLLSGMPHMFRMLWAFIISQLGDYLLRTNKMSRTNVRKLATAICTMGQGVFMLGLAYSGCNYTAAIVFVTAAVAMHGAVSTGPLASVVDISPNYASVILGIINTVVASVGFMTPILAGYLTYNNQTVVQYQKFFWVATILLFGSGILYTLFSNSELQPWNSPQSENDKPEEELMVIKSKKTEKEEDNQITKNYEVTSVIYTNDTDTDK